MSCCRNCTDSTFERRKAEWTHSVGEVGHFAYGLCANPLKVFSSQILKYSSDGGEEILVSDDGSHEVLNSPTALEFDQYGNMFVNDKYNHRVVMFPLESGIFQS